MTDPPNESAPAKTEATSKLTHSQNSTATVVAEINVLDIIKATSSVSVFGYRNDTAPGAAEATSTVIGSPVSLQAEQLDVQDIADLEPCTCELTGRCTSCENLPWVIRQRQLAQTVTTLNSSPSSWDSSNREPQREWQ